MKRSREDLIIGLLVILLILQVYGLFFHRQVVVVESGQERATQATTVESSPAPQLRPPATPDAKARQRAQTPAPGGGSPGATR